MNLTKTPARSGVRALPAAMLLLAAWLVTTTGQAVRRRLNPMRFALVMMILLRLTEPRSVNAATELWPVTDGQLNPIPFADVVIKPLSAPNTNGLGGFGTKDLIYATTDSNGLATITNLIVGQYTASVSGPYTVTPVTFTVSNFVQTLYIAQNSTIPTNNPATATAFSMAGSDSRYVKIPTLDGVAQNGWVPTSTNAGAAYMWAPQAGAVITSNYQALSANVIINSNLLQGSNATFFTVTASNGFTGNLTGSASTATTATTAISFSGSLIGDVTGTQGATVVSQVFGVTAANISGGANQALASTSANTASTIVKRDGSGGFSAGTITASLTGNVTGNASGSAGSFTGSLVGDVTGTQGATVVSHLGAISGSGITNLMGNAGQFTNGIPFINTTNCYVNLFGGDPTINLTHDACVVYTTNGPGRISMTFADQDGANHNVLVPSACHLYGTNIISSFIGSNSVVVVTNGFTLTLVIRQLNAATTFLGATNTIIFMGESAN